MLTVSIILNLRLLTRLANNNILEVLHERAHSGCMSSWCGRLPDKLDVMLREETTDGVHEEVGVFFSPKVDVEGVEFVEVFCLVSEIVVW